MLIVKASYGVQVKSRGTEFQFKGKQATQWLNDLEFPLFLADVSKEESNIKIYSTWNINRFLLGLHTKDIEKYPDQLVFIASNNGRLIEPDAAKGEIPIGHPILDFNITDLGDDVKRQKYWEIMKEWLSFDSINYFQRKAGIACAFGYIEWETNKSLRESHRIWYKPYFFSSYHVKSLKRIFYDCAISVGYFNKENYKGNPQDSFKNEFNSLRKFVLEYLNDNMEPFGKNLFENEI